ncbi:NAD-dependent epimerase/dehydratase family protein [Cohnella soli]|uniref:NAD-dependent epimerase/dehydratase family protein n=1 Tax=Cohnella soli TaxID=425005 RepID=A0ABW0HVY2_9BACL
MKIAVAGASGVIGRALIPLLIQDGHEVTGFTRNAGGAASLSDLGAKPIILDVFDREAMFDALQETKPDVVIHQLTSLGARNFADNAKIRKEGTRNLVDASLAAGVNKMIVQSISWAYLAGDGPASEECPLDLEAPDPRKTTVEGICALESAAAEMPEHVILRYGLFYGAGTWYAPDGYMAEQVRQRQLNATEGIASFVHVSDAAKATRLALAWPSGAYNIVDHEPAAGTEWLPVYAEMIGAPEPTYRREHGRWERGASNDKALIQGWTPACSWRDGFRHALNK